MLAKCQEIVASFLDLELALKFFEGKTGLI